MTLSVGIPIIRIFSEAKAKEFYLDFLGFRLDWEHRFEADFPLYAQVTRSDLTLHLSEHHGDATPDSAVFIPVTDIAALQQELLAKEYKYAKPSIETVDWGRVMQIMYPYGNCLRFCKLSED